MTSKILFGKMRVSMHDFSHTPTLAVILVVIVFKILYSTLQCQQFFLLNALLNPGTVCLPPFKILVAREFARRFKKQSILALF